MTNKTYRFAAVAAVLLALLVFAAPVGAEDGVEFKEVSTFDELKNNLTAGNATKLIADVSATESIDIPAGKSVLSI